MCFSDLGIFQTYLCMEIERLGIANRWNFLKLRCNSDVLQLIISYIKKPLIGVYCKLLANTWSLN